MAPPKKKQARILAVRETPCLRCTVAMARAPTHRCEVDKASKSTDKCVASRSGGKVMVEIPGSLRAFALDLAEASQELAAIDAAGEGKTKASKENHALLKGEAEEAWISAKSKFDEAYQAYKENLGIDPLAVSAGTLQARCPELLPGGSATASTSQPALLQLSQEDIKWVKDTRAALDGKIEHVVGAAEQYAAFAEKDNQEMDEDNEQSNDNA